MKETPKGSPFTQPPDRVSSSFMDRMLASVQDMAHLIGAPGRNRPRSILPEVLGMWEKVNRIYDEYLKYETGRLRKRGFNISCTPGCSWCCRNMPTGVMHLEVVAAHQHLTRAGMLNKAIKRALDAAELWNRVIRNTGDEEAALTQFARESHCPFLDHKRGLCAIYPVRPLVCRSHFATTPAHWCDPESESFKGAVKISLEPVRQVQDQLSTIEERLGPGLPRSIAEAFLVFTLKGELRGE